MSTLELQAELAKRIFNIESEEVLNELSTMLKRLTGQSFPPAIPTGKEINARAERVISAIENGETERFIAHDQLKKRHVS